MFMSFALRDSDSLELTESSDLEVPSRSAGIAMAAKQASKPGCSGCRVLLRLQPVLPRAPPGERP